MKNEKCRMQNEIIDGKRPCLPLWGRWHGEAVTKGTPSVICSANASSPSGGARLLFWGHSAFLHSAFFLPSLYFCLLFMI